MFPFLIDENNLLFSIDGKTFNKNIEGLKYTIEDKMFVNGSYEKELKPNQKLSFLLLNQDVNNKTTNTIIFAIPIILMLVLISLIIIKIKINKKKI